MQTIQTSRRTFIKTMGYLSVGFSMFGTSCIDRADSANLDQEYFPTLADPNQVNAWLQILEDGRVKIFTGKMELGQGIQTAIMQVAAEELDMNMDLIEIHIADTDHTPNEGYTTGSNSIESSAMTVRYAAATAREKLLKLASEKMSIPSTQLSLKDGIVSSAHNKMSLQELLKGKQLEDNLDKSVEIKAKTVRKFVGKPIPRKDIENIVRAKTVFLHDLRFSGMVHARIVRPTSYASKLLNLDEKELSTQPGFLKLVRLGSFVGIIAEEEYQAVQLREKASKIAKWSNPTKLPTDKSLKEYILSLPTDTNVDEQTGNWETQFKQSHLQHSASYFKPYLMHASNGPSCAIALYQNGKLDVWAHSQGVYPLRESLVNLLQIPQENIHIKGVPGSGCYGHNGADDAAAEAALLAINYPGKHVRLQWMRDDEHGWEPYGTAMIMDLKAGLDTSGKITAWKYDLWSDEHSTRPRGQAASLLAARYLEKGHGEHEGGFRGGATRNAMPYYKIENLNLESHIFKAPIRRSALRGLGAYANVFAIEVFMDELAHLAQKDPIDFRLMHLADERAKECLQKLKSTTAQVKSEPGEGIGYAFSRYKNSAAYCAVAAKVRINRENGETKVIKMWAVIDAGEVINLDGLINQTEGGMIQSASWALKEEVRFDEQHITSLDWASYPIFRFNDAPETEVEVIDRVQESPLGAGEAAQGPATAAVINAIFAASGVRIRELPVKSELLIKS